MDSWVDKRNPSSAASLLAFLKVMQQSGSLFYWVLRTAYTYQEKKRGGQRAKDKRESAMYQYGQKTGQGLGKSDFVGSYVGGP